MKTISSYLIIAILAFSSTAKAGSPLWLRQSSISPDGQNIAFCYKGDIYLTGINGGEARQLTTSPAYDFAPIWSPDSKTIAFASNREGNNDIYIMSAKGGKARKLTFSPCDKTPVAFKSNSAILYLCNERPASESVQFPSGTFQQLYEVSTEKRKSVLDAMVSSLPMENISISKDGNIWLYQDVKGYEDEYRKHHTSSITRNIWSWDVRNNTYKKLTTFKGEDRNPVWGENGSFYYLSEENGSFNVFKRENGSDKSIALTSFSQHPIRSLSRADNGILCFSFNGELYTLKEGEQPKKLEIDIISDDIDQELIRTTLSSGVTDFSASPDGKEIVFVVRGDVYVTSSDYSTTRKITDTPGQERNVSFAPDGKSVVYDSERNGLWQIYQSSIEDKDGKSMLHAKKIKEVNLTNNDQTSFQPLISPDGKYVAYLENRTTRRVLDIKTGKSVVALDGKYNYSYSDGDQNFEWSPDSKWLLTNYIGIGGWNNQDIALVKADGTEVHNLTQSGYSDGYARFVLDGKAMVWASDRAGYRSHGSWGSEDDYYIMFFDVEAFDKFKMNKEDLELLEAQKTEKEKKQEEKKEDKKKEDAKEGKIAKVEELKFDFANINDRIIRLTDMSGHMGDCVLDSKGEVFYYEAISPDGNSDLWKHDLKEESTTKLVSGMSSNSLHTDKETKTIFYIQNGGLFKLDIGSTTPKSIGFEAQFNYRPAEERAYIFDHCWRQVNEKFYDSKIHGIDWKMYHDNYKRFLPYINNNEDFSIMLSEMLGELNGSHTGSGYRTRSNTLPVARLGLFYDYSYKDKGLKIKEIVARSPLAEKKTDVKEGMIITHIDGVEINDSTDQYYLLTGKAGKNVTLTIAKEEGGKEFDVEIKPISSSKESGILYKRWVERNRKYVEEKTKGKIGYIHIKDMDSRSFRTLYSELLGKYRNTEGVIIDTRHNGGGWLHDDVITLLSAKEYARYVPRGQYIGSDPYNKYTKKSCMLVCEDNYSNAHGTPWLYKELGIGKLIGAPVPGTMTAVWWETQIDPTLYFGIPQVGCTDMNGRYLENMELQPDIEIYNDPADVIRGKDAQLDAAIEEMLKK